MKRNPQVIIEEIEKTQEIIEGKELEVYLLKSKLTKLNLELVEATYFGD